MNSMTGFGRGVANGQGCSVTVELSAVNRKQLDVRVNVPRSLSVLEPKVTKAVRGAVSRGGITVSVRLDGQPEGRPERVNVDMARADAYMQAADTLRKRHALPEQIRVAELLQLPGVLLQEAGADGDSQQVWPLLSEALERALPALLQMRVTEGRALQKDVRRRLRRLQRLRERVARRSPRTVQQYRKNLEKRISGLDLQPGPELDAALAREVVLFADRCDIAEELVRLDSHIAQGVALLEAEKPVGRTLEFLCQELLREMNTIGSKANDAGIAADIVAMKTELEALREQVQNVE